MENKWNTPHVAPKGFQVEFLDMNDQSEPPRTQPGRNVASEPGSSQNPAGDRLGMQLPNEVRVQHEIK
jgi:hypothetical protein